MKNFSKYFSMLMLAIGIVCVTACGGSDDDAPTTINTPVIPVSNNLTITNNSSYTLARFTVIFWNDYNETVTNKDYGTFTINETKSIEIPAGATQYYMATYLASKWFVSPTYKLANYRSLALTTDMVNAWTTTTSAPEFIPSEQ